ncbi:MAG: EAL domain-containing protein [Rhodospirillales bacterium]|nr:EAL domain-containing protein [Rhodospirillales bacterium]
MPEEFTVGDIAQRQVLNCSPDLCIADAAQKMRESACSSIIVMVNGIPEGIWTERDALSIDFSDLSLIERPISEVMSTPLKTISNSTSLSKAAVKLRKLGLRHFLVLDDDENFVGMVSQTDIILNQSVDHFLDLRQVGSALRQPLVMVEGTASLSEVVRKMQEFHSDAAVVDDIDGKGYGIITERDIIRLTAERRISETAHEIASRPLITIPVSAALVRAKDLLEKQKFRHVGVTGNNGGLLGLLSFSDILESIQYNYVSKLEEAVKERDNALLRSEENLKLAHKVIDAAPDAIMIVSADGKIETVNPAFTTLTEYLPHEVIGKNPSILASGAHDKEFYSDMWRVLHETGSWRGEVWNRRKSGGTFPEWLSITVIRDEMDNISRYASIFSDISERKEKEERIKNLAYFDVLTGLPNRQLFNDRLAQSVSSTMHQDTLAALLVLNLDLFKRINDSFGHYTGDRVLEVISQRLKLLVRSEDTLSRLSGDEFAILMPIVDASNEAINLARRIVDEVSIPIDVEDREIFLTASVGVALCPDDGIEAEILLKNAFAATHRAKKIGRNCYQLYSSSLNALAVERMEMETFLRRAPEKNEFHLEYQPKVDMLKGRVAGVEALVRWNHPMLGRVMPSDFIQLAEDIGMIHVMGEWVLRESCRQATEWSNKGFDPMHVAVNVSARQFERGNFLNIVKDTLNVSGLAPENLELELTESTLMENMEDVISILGELRNIGVKVSIDDFGTGYSSLSYLKRMPIDCLKIDQSFVSDMDNNEDDASIVSTIIAMARSLNMSVIAEGVETKAQLGLLAEQGCEEIQGYLISRPVSSSDIETMLDRDLLGEFR